MYNNTYNNNIAEQLKKNNKRHIKRQEEAATMGDTSFTSHLEGMALRDSDVVGGSGYVEATVRDQGFENETTNGVVGSGEVIVKKKRTRKPKKVVGGAILGLADIETEPRGDNDIIPPVIKSAPRASKNKETDVNEKPPPTTKISRKPVKSKVKDEKVEEVKNEENEDDGEEDEDNEQLGSGKAKAKAKAKDSKPKRVNKYALLVKEIMQKHNIKNLAAASKYIKEHNLYVKKSD